MIDKLAHQDRYGPRAKHPYHYAVELLLERFCKFLRKHGGVGELVAEGRGDKEDRLLTEQWGRFIRDGTRFMKPYEIQPLLAQTAIAIRKKSQNIGGLQLADLLAFTCTHDVLKDEKQIASFRDAMSGYIAGAIQAKYDRHAVNGRVSGCGKVLIK